MERQARGEVPVGIGEVDELRQRARHCRERAGASSDPRLEAMLKLLAHAYDQRAATSRRARGKPGATVRD